MTAGMRVLVLSHMYPRPRHVAGGVFVHDQVRALRQRGIDARVVTGEPFWVQTLNPVRMLRGLRAYLREAPAWGEWETVPVLHFPYVCGYLFRPSIHALTYVHGLQRVLPYVHEQFAFDLIHAHTSFLDGTAGLAVRNTTGRPLVITEHTGPFGLLTRNALMRQITRRAVVGADRLLAVSASLRQDMVEAFARVDRAIDVLPNGIDPHVFHPRPRVRAAAADEPIRALWVGHHVEIKRVDRLLHAFARVAPQHNRLRLTLLGDGEGRAAMAELARELGIADRVSFAPAADRFGVADAMRAHDFLVVSSAKETFSLVVLEALACGIPVLSTACGGPESLITEPASGLIVSNDVEGLVKGLTTMAARVGAEAHGQTEIAIGTRHTWSAVAEELAAIYEALLRPQALQAA